MRNDHITLTCGPLTVTLPKPDAVYHGSRFEHSVIFDSVVWNGHEFASVELPEGEPGPTSKGTGMIGELRGVEAVTFKENEMGSKFMKLGVGTLINDLPGRYSFMHEYPVAELCTTRVLPREHGLTVITTQPRFEGFEFVTVKDIRLTENTLTVETTLINTGDRDLDTVEYNHNFAAIDRQLLDDGAYELTVADGCDLTPILGEKLTAKGQTLCFEGNREVFYADLGTGTTPERFTLISKTAGVGMKETDRGELGRLYLWGKNHVISPEGYLHITAAAGSSASWQRKWEFFSLD